MAEFEAKAAGQKGSPEVVFSTLTPLDNVVSFISNWVENVFSPTTQPSRASLGDRADYWDRL